MPPSDLPTLDEAVGLYLHFREQKVSPATLQRDEILLALALHGLELSGRDDLACASQAAEALPLLLAFGQQRFGSDRKDHKAYLTSLKGFCSWGITAHNLDSEQKSAILQQFQLAEASCKKAEAVRLPKHKWSFVSKFRKGAYPWNGTGKAQNGLKVALSELRAVARVDAGAAAEGATVLLEKLVPAIERIDSSSGAIGMPSTTRFLSLHRWWATAIRHRDMRRESSAASRPFRRMATATSTI